jgi:hypothetical protein
LELRRKQSIKYPYQAVTDKLKGLTFQRDYHFFLLLKSLEYIDGNNVKQVSYLLKSEIAKAASLLNYKSSTFYSKLNKLIKRGWIIRYSKSYGIKSLNKINNNLNFKPYTNTSGITYHPFQKVENIANIDLDKKRIELLINQSRIRFKHVLNEPNKNSTKVLSKYNTHLKTRKGAVSTVNNMFKISLPKLMVKGGYESINYLSKQIKAMEKQGFKVKRTINTLIGYKYECNEYVLNDLNYSTAPVPKTKSVKKLTDEQEMFNKFLNDHKMQYVCGGYVNPYYWNRKIPVTMWSKLIGIALKNNYLKAELAKYMDLNKIRFEIKEVKAWNPIERYSYIDYKRMYSIQY